MRRVGRVASKRGEVRGGGGGRRRRDETRARASGSHPRVLVVALLLARAARTGRRGRARRATASVVRATASVVRTTARRAAARRAAARRAAALLALLALLALGLRRSPHRLDEPRVRHRRVRVSGRRLRRRRERSFGADDVADGESNLRARDGDDGVPRIVHRRRVERGLGRLGETPNARVGNARGSRGFNSSSLLLARPPRVERGKRQRRISTGTPRLQRRSRNSRNSASAASQNFVLFFILAAPSALAEPFPVREEREESSPRGRRGREPPAVRRAPRSGRESFLPREFRRGSVGVVGGDDPRRRQLRQRVLVDSRTSRRRATSEFPRARLLRRVRANYRLRISYGGEFEVRPERFAFRGGERFASRGVGETSSSARVGGGGGVRGGVHRGEDERGGGGGARRVAAEKALAEGRAEGFHHRGGRRGRRALTEGDGRNASENRRCGRGQREGARRREGRVVGVTPRATVAARGGGGWRKSESAKMREVGTGGRGTGARTGLGWARRVVFRRRGSRAAGGGEGRACRGPTRASRRRGGKQGVGVDARARRASRRRGARERQARRGARLRAAPRGAALPRGVGRSDASASSSRRRKCGVEHAERFARRVWKRASARGAPVDGGGRAKCRRGPRREPLCGGARRFPTLVQASKFRAR